MANTPNDYRDPKVSTTTEKTGNRNWLWIALAVLAGLILLAFLLGLFGGDDEEVDAVVTDDAAVTTTTDDVDAVVVEEPTE